jgi:hypothetical protein
MNRANKRCMNIERGEKKENVIQLYEDDDNMT